MDPPAALSPSMATTPVKKKSKLPRLHLSPSIKSFQGKRTSILLLSKNSKIPTPQKLFACPQSPLSSSHSNSNEDQDSNPINSYKSESSHLHCLWESRFGTTTNSFCCWHEKGTAWTSSQILWPQYNTRINLPKWWVQAENYEWQNLANQIRNQENIGLIEGQTSHKTFIKFTSEKRQYFGKNH